MAKVPRGLPASIRSSDEEAPSTETGQLYSDPIAEKPLEAGILAIILHGSVLRGAVGVGTVFNTA